MGEFLRHLVGACGEHWHPNLLNISAITVAFAGLISYLKISILSLWNRIKRR